MEVGGGGGGGGDVMVEDETPNEIIMKLQKKQNEMEERIRKLERKTMRRADLVPPIKDYMDWIRTLTITADDRKRAFSSMCDVIRNILVRNEIHHAGIFYKWCSVTGSGGESNRVLIAKKVVGEKMMIMTYKWEYMKVEDIVNIADYFMNIFKMEFIEWYNENNDKIRYRVGDYFTLYNQYYKNVMLINEKMVSANIKDIVATYVAGK
jgi:hypothetical protein